MRKYIIKQIPEDFIVNELFEFNQKQGKYGIFLLKKKNYTTTNAVRTISRILQIPLKNIGFAGMKDKNAVTTQHISILNCKKEINIENLSTKFLGTTDEPITLGSHKGNQFEITVRNITEKPVINEKFINFFGEQRFSRNNVEIGLAIIKKDWKKAINLIDNEFVKNHLNKNPNDYLGALKTLPIKITRLFVSAYQSYLWNKTVEIVRGLEFGVRSTSTSLVLDLPQTTNPNLQTIMIPGFGVDIHPVTQELLEKDNLTSRDFIIRQFPQLTLEGVEREVFAVAKSLEVSELINDELNKGKKKIILKFSLNNGCYATEFIKQVFS